MIRPAVTLSIYVQRPSTTMADNNNTQATNSNSVLQPTILPSIGWRVCFVSFTRSFHLIRMWGHGSERRNNESHKLPPIRFIDGPKKNPFFPCNRVSFASWIWQHCCCWSDVSKKRKKHLIKLAVGLQFSASMPSILVGFLAKVNYYLRVLTGAGERLFVAHFHLFQSPNRIG